MDSRTSAEDQVVFLTAQLRFEREKYQEEIQKLKEEIRLLRYNNRL